MLGPILLLQLASMAHLFAAEVVGMGMAGATAQPPSRAGPTWQLSWPSPDTVALLATESQYVTNGKAAYQLATRKQRILWGNGKDPKYIEKILAQPFLHVAHSMILTMIETSKDKQKMNKLKEQMKTHWPQPLTQHLDWFAEHCPRCQILDTDNPDYARLEVTLPRACFLKDVTHPEDEERWTPTVAMLMVIQHVSKEKGYRNLRDFSPDTSAL